MKIVIDIPEDIYKLVIEAYKKDKELQTRPNLFMAVANGIPFEDREKGEQLYSDLLRVKHGTMNIDSLIEKVYADMRGTNV